MSEKNKEKKLSGGNHTVKKRGNDNKKKEGTACKVAKKCGGCQYQGVPYEKQLSEKQKAVRQLMQPFCKTAEITGMQDPYHYRNKVHAVFARKKDGTIISGVYEEGTHRVVPVEACQIEDEKADAIINDIRGLLKSFKIKTYNEDTGYGLLRHVLIRKGFTTGEVMVCLILNGNKILKEEQLVKSLCEIPGMTSITINVNKKHSNVILGEEIRLLWGQEYITDRIGDISYQISPLSFYQVNPMQTQKLYAKALEYADLHGEETVWDLYCGIGTISLFLAQKAKFVRGVEIVPAAIENAKENAKLNGLENTEFFVGKAEEVLPREYKKNGVYADVIVVDPPRKGCDETLLETMIEMNPERIVYVSCDSATLARDLKYLCARGYELRKVCPVDQFGMTVHVETVVLLQRKNM